MSEVKNNNSEDSFKKRYSFKLITNIIGLGIGLITQSIVPRALGPASYGNFSFLTSFFWSVAGFLNFNSSTFFYTKLSQKQDDKTLVGFYFYFVLIIGLFLGVILAFPVVLGYNEIIWPEQKFIFVILGAIWAYMSFYVMILVDMSDAYGLTVKSEKVNTVLKIVGLTIILIMFWKNWFSLLNYFLYHLLILALSISALIYIIFKNKKSLSPFWRLDNAQVKKYAKDFSKFCAPLIVFTFLGVVAQILERWFLQTFSGSVKQGFFALSSQVASISFLFTSAVMPLVLRDQAISFGNKDLERSQKIFKRSTFTLYLLTTFFCCFIAVEAKTVLLFFGGQAYSEALVPLAIMSLYPIHQTYGQLNGNFFFATERVVAYRNIGLIFIFIGIPITFFLLGPEKYGALQYGNSMSINGSATINMTASSFGVILVVTTAGATVNLPQKTTVTSGGCSLF